MLNTEIYPSPIQESSEVNVVGGVESTPDLEGFSVEKAIISMVAIQNELNTKSYDTSWLEKGKTGEFDYAIAAAQETGEYLDSLPFAWWSSQPEDRRNCITELVDAWHFIMSQAIIDNGGDQVLAVRQCSQSYHIALAGVSGEPLTNLDLQRKAKRLIVALYTNLPNDELSTSAYLNAFFDLCLSYQIDIRVLYSRYTGKATLNQFRQENGYSAKPRTYKKMWSFDGKTEEDNYFVSTFVDERLQEGCEVTADLVRAYLIETYAEVK